MRAHDHRFFSSGFLALAHRGGSLLAANLGIENSLQAMRNAVALGITHVETDVHATCDGVLLAFHDDTLNRVTDGTGRVAEMTAAQIRECRIGGREPVPTLDEVLEELPQTYFNIDIKADGAVAPLAETIARHGAQHRVNVASFSARRLGVFRRLAGPTVSTSAGPLGTAWTALVPGAPRLLPARGVAFQVPLTWPVAGREVPIVTEAMIARAHAAGRVVHVWTINERGDMERLLDMGVDGIVTDRPDTLMDVLRARSR